MTQTNQSLIDLPALKQAFESLDQGFTQFNDEKQLFLDAARAYMHQAQQPEDVVGVVAEGIFNYENPYAPWEAADEGTKEHWRGKAKAAIAAMPKTQQPTDYIRMRLAQIASGDYKACGLRAEDVAKDAIAAMTIMGGVYGVGQSSDLKPEAVGVPVSDKDDNLASPATDTLIGLLTDITICTNKINEGNYPIATIDVLAHKALKEARNHNASVINESGAKAIILAVAEQAAKYEYVPTWIAEVAYERLRPYLCPPQSTTPLKRVETNEDALKYAQQQMTAINIDPEMVACAIRYYVKKAPPPEVKTSEIPVVDEEKILLEIMRGMVGHGLHLINGHKPAAMDILSRLKREGYLSSTKRESVGRTYPELLTEDEKQTLLQKSVDLWNALEENKLGGFSSINRPYFIMHEFKEVIEKYGKRDVGLTWSSIDLQKARKNNTDIEGGN